MADTNTILSDVNANIELSKPSFYDYKRDDDVFVISIRCLALYGKQLICTYAFAFKF